MASIHQLSTKMDMFIVTSGKSPEYDQLNFGQNGYLYQSGHSSDIYYLDI